jgi:hypothetical protein
MILIEILIVIATLFLIVYILSRSELSDNEKEIEKKKDEEKLEREAEEFIRDMREAFPYGTRKRIATDEDRKWIENNKERIIEQ